MFCEPFHTVHQFGVMNTWLEIPVKYTEFRPGFSSKNSPVAQSKVVVPVCLCGSEVDILPLTVDDEITVIIEIRSGDRPPVHRDAPAVSG